MNEIVWFRGNSPMAKELFDYVCSRYITEPINFVWKDFLNEIIICSNGKLEILYKNTDDAKEIMKNGKELIWEDIKDSYEL